MLAQFNAPEFLAWLRDTDGIEPKAALLAPEEKDGISVDQRKYLTNIFNAVKAFRVKVITDFRPKYSGGNWIDPSVGAVQHWNDVEAALRLPGGEMSWPQVQEQCSFDSDVYEWLRNLVERNTKPATPRYGPRANELAKAFQLCVLLEQIDLRNSIARALTPPINAQIYCDLTRIVNETMDTDVSFITVYERCVEVYGRSEFKTAKMDTFLRLAEEGVDAQKYNFLEAFSKFCRAESASDKLLV